jgi:hypothetical protein
MSHPYCLGQSAPLFNNLTMKNTPEVGVGMSDWCLSEWVLAQWRLVAFKMNLLHWAMLAIVTAHHHSHQHGQQSGHILHRCFVCCRPSGRRGDMESLSILLECSSHMHRGRYLLMLQLIGFGTLLLDRSSQFQATHLHYLVSQDRILTVLVKQPWNYAP